MGVIDGESLSDGVSREDSLDVEIDGVACMASSVAYGDKPDSAVVDVVVLDDPSVRVDTCMETCARMIMGVQLWTSAWICAQQHGCVCMYGHVGMRLHRTIPRHAAWKCVWTCVQTASSLAARVRVLTCARACAQACV